MSTRRTLLAAAGTAWLAAPHRVLAQAATGKRRIAYLSVGSPDSSGYLIGLFTSGLRELGWIEGTNLILDLRFAQGDTARYAPLTSELLALQPDVFVTSTDVSAGAAAATTKSVPIVFVIGTDPVGRGLVKSLASPGGNVTGFASLDFELGPKRLQLLTEAIPGLNKVGVFTSSLTRFELELQDASRKLGLVLVPVLVDRPEDIDGAFEKFAKAGVKAVLAASGATIFMAPERIADLAIRHRMAMFGAPAIADSGVLLSYGQHVPTLFRRAAPLVDRILKGAKPADIPVEQVNVYELVVNLRTARALGIELPRSLVLQATRVIE